MEAPPNLFVGKSFASYSELSLFMAEYEFYYRQKFWKRSSRKITSTANIKRHINPELVYYEISYACIHGGEKFKSRSKGLRKSITFRLGPPCSAYIRLRAAPDGQTLDVKAFSDLHNHVSTQNRWTVNQVEALIEQYKKYPILYDPKLDGHDNSDLKSSCLIDIVQALQHVRLGVTEVEVTSQWNNLVVKFFQNQSRELSGELNGDLQFWYLQKLDFLKDHLGATDIKLEDCDISVETQSWPSRILHEEIEPQSPKKLPDEYDDSISVTSEVKVSRDECDIFGEFITTQLKKIKDEEIRQDTIFEIHQVVHKALKTNLL